MRYYFPFVFLIACAPSTSKISQDACASAPADAVLDPTTGALISGDPSRYALQRSACPRFLVDLVVPRGKSKLSIDFSSMRGNQGCSAWIERARLYQPDSERPMVERDLASSRRCMWGRQPLVASVSPGRYRLALSAHADGAPLPVYVGATVQ